MPVWIAIFVWGVHALGYVKRGINQGESTHLVAVIALPAVSALKNDKKLINETENESLYINC